MHHIGGVAQASPWRMVAGALLNSHAASTVPQLPLKSSRNHPSKGGKAAPGSLASCCSLSNFLERKLSLTMWEQRLGTRPLHHGEAGLLLALPPTNPHKSTGLCTCLGGNYSSSRVLYWVCVVGYPIQAHCGPAIRPDHLLYPIQQQAPGTMKPTPSPMKEKSLPGTEGRSSAMKATVGLAE